MSVDFWAGLAWGIGIGFFITVIVSLVVMFFFMSEGDEHEHPGQRGYQPKGPDGPIGPPPKNWRSAVMPPPPPNKTKTW